MYIWDFEIKEKTEMRVKIREGLESVDFVQALNGKAKGFLYTPASRNDLKFWIDKSIFSSYVQKDGFRLCHKNIGCSGSEIHVTQNLDRPNIKLSCSYCLKSWQVHQLDGLPPKSFSAIFEYRINVSDDDWPSIIVTKSNGVTKYTTLMTATVEQAADYFFRGFDSFRKNGFVKASQ
jgi:hypothetical protein